MCFRGYPSDGFTYFLDAKGEEIKISDEEVARVAKFCPCAIHTMTPFWRWFACGCYHRCLYSALPHYEHYEIAKLRAEK